MTGTTGTRLHNRAMASPVGTLLSKRYRLDAQVGSGGMSTVYLAFDTVLERQVAIKLMHREIAGDSDQLERFRRVARAVAQLNHPHIVGVIDAGEEGDPEYPTPYIVFEYVEGETLKDRIRRHGRLPVPEAIAYAIEVARGLGAAHACGIVHRDVKPQNVLVDGEGAAKVTDFGIARSLHQEGLTADGRVLGTTDYVSPEQALGQAVSGQSDLYSLGIVLFEMLCGDVPFKAENQIAVAMRHVREQLPDVQLRRPEVSAALAAVLERATSKELDRRYPDAQSMIADLEDVLAIETARSGQVTGEATTVLKSLPDKTRRRVPWGVRRSTKAFFALIVAGIALAAVLAYVAADNTVRGTGMRADAPPTPGVVEVPLPQRAASDFDPIGGDGEHPSQTSAIVDDIKTSTWSTERYKGNTLNKAGVGVVIDAAPAGVAGSQLEVQTPTPGFEATVYVAPWDTPKTAPPVGWTKAGPTRPVRDGEKFDLDTAGNRFRRYLLWITKLPPGEDKVEISEILLYKYRAARRTTTPQNRYPRSR
ncbi:MAG: eukaryotic-like serine/threonine-protein kinase [Solirubrobacteraceae bacterium]|nr:eukaryotic-like serine/threonine-protein kinase [Solirubrobacteraceae bacterium]